MSRIELTVRINLRLFSKIMKTLDSTIRCLLQVTKSVHITINSWQITNSYMIS